MFKLFKFTMIMNMNLMIKILNELTRVQPQESHPPGVVGAAHPGIGHNSDKDKIGTAGNFRFVYQSFSLQPTGLS